MSLFSRALNNHMLKLLRKASWRCPQRPLSLDEMGGLELAPLSAFVERDELEVMFVARTVAQMPKEVHDLIRVALCGEDDEAARRASKALLALPRWAKERIYRALEHDSAESAVGRPPLRRVLMPRPI